MPLKLNTPRICENCRASFYPWRGRPGRFCSTICKKKFQKVVDTKAWDRIAKKLLPPNQNGCRIWTGSTNGTGYGSLSIHSKKHYVHILMYENQYGPVPDGLELDHTCKNRLCASVNHLEAVPHDINSLRSASPNVRAYHANKCRHGHELTPNNTLVINESRRGLVRRCKQCRRASSLKFRSKRLNPIGHRGSNNVGSKNPLAKLNEKLVEELRLRYYHGGETISSLAREVGISVAAIHNAVKGKTWEHVDGLPIAVAKSEPALIDRSERYEQLTAIDQEFAYFEFKSNERPINRLSIFERDKLVCQICSKEIDRKAKSPHPLSASIDHIVSRKNLGSDCPDNLRTAHRVCNIQKGSR